MKDIRQYGKIYAILGERFSRGRTNLETARILLDSGVGILQYREKQKTKEQKLEECLQLRELTKQYRAVFLVNDDPLLARASLADGVHLGQDDLGELDQIEGIFGISTHQLLQAQKAMALSPSYIAAGPMFPTGTKPEAEPSEGLLYLKQLRGLTTLPIVAIGGLQENNIVSVQEAGADLFAMISELVAADDIPRKVKRLKELLGDSF